MEMTETMPSLTQDTQAILLLCARLGQRDGESAKPLTTHQYSMLAKWLHEQSLRPRDLLHDVGRERLSALDLKDVTREIVMGLLERGTALAVLVERWVSHGLWVISRGDPEYPNRYKNYLQHAAPPILFGVGDISVLQCGGLAVVGSRNSSEEELEFARCVGSKCASQQISVISGAAKGIDSESMQAVLDQGGRAIGVLAEGLGSPKNPGMTYPGYSSAPRLLLLCLNSHAREPSRRTDRMAKPFLPLRQSGQKQLCKRNRHGWVRMRSCTKSSR
jgi:hypothetical protein